MTLRSLWGRLVRHWPRKLAATLLAFLMWLFVSTTETTTTQRSLLVPITVEGSDPEQAVVGIPAFAEVSVSGPSNRIDRLRPESIDAVIDLAGVTGEFQVPVDVTPPQGVVLERVNPAEVIGLLEAVVSKRVPVQVVHLGSPPDDLRVHSATDPAVVTVRGRAPRIERSTQAIVAVVASEGDALIAPFAADAAGRPVEDVTVEPERVLVSTSLEPVLVRREVPLRLVPPSHPRLVEASLDQPTVVVAGPPSVVATLEALDALVDLPTESPPTGRYTRPVTVETPSGVVSVGTVTATVVFDSSDAPQ